MCLKWIVGRLRYSGLPEKDGLPRGIFDNQGCVAHMERGGSYANLDDLSTAVF
jgi:hypothetical protein